MAYDRYDTRDYPRDERSRWRSDRSEGRGWDRDRDERGFFERAGDEVASWFGDDEAERRRQMDRMRDEREGRSRREYGRDEDRGRFFGRERDDDRWTPADRFGARRWSERGPSSRREMWGRERDRDFGENRQREYQPMTGDYGRSEESFATSGYGRGERRRPESEYGRDDYRRSSDSGSHTGSRERDPHYRSWRDRHMSELDRDYDDYSRENQSRFEDDFGSWRERRQEKRGLLGRIREHMEVVGSDNMHVGTIDRVAGDRIILTKSDPESGGIHHSMSCSDIDRIEDDRVVLDCTAEQARQRWRDESRSRALFEREDQGEMGPRVLDRSFEGTYR
jgi:hypothetical protein